MQFQISVGSSGEKERAPMMSERELGQRIQTVVGKLRTILGDVVMCQVEGNTLKVSPPKNQNFPSKVPGVIKTIVEGYCSRNGLQCVTET